MNERITVRERERTDLFPVPAYLLLKVKTGEKLYCGEDCGMKKVFPGGVTGDRSGEGMKLSELLIRMTDGQTD